MKIKNIFILIIAFLHISVACLQAQNHADLALSTAGKQSTVALSWTKLYSIGEKKRFKIGYGARFSSAFHKNVEYVTAPARLTSGVANPTAMFRDNILANFDTISFNKAQINSLNATINLQYSFHPKFDLGFNIDAIGFSFGKKQVGVYTSSIYTGGKVTSQTAKPTGFNALLISDNDNGSLNSEFYARYWLTEKLGIRAGMVFIFAEYTTDKKLSLDNNRFRNKSSQAMLAVSYKF